ncbi:ATP-binding cassette domain-containing protein [Hafnia alvei]|uniref:Peptide/nickel transport system ATP-binding protein n=1 Tax=Hafnia alvei TaxID=569 RepID=A0A1C6YVB5_HAFAL|nr:ATP-binding cassette domain-containing protein [Hafnia alvei]NLS55907.1 ATP-binding cassette domain-containing protein [Hafnia alvei]SCM50783.1 peptide/nickel transport system ATP-binding protein [Hafnia alvei]
MLRISALSIEQDKRQLWHDFSLNVLTGERVGISAPSGYGKTTLGRVLAGWQPYQQGSITLDDAALPCKGYCPVQLVPQHPELTFNPYRTTGQALRDAWHPDAEQLSRFHVKAEWLTRKPNQLSGGELARIALLRALDPRTRVLIADEVTAQLDPHIQRDIWQQLIIESQQRPLSMIIFSHQRALLEQICTRVEVIA